MSKKQKFNFQTLFFLRLRKLLKISPRVAKKMFLIAAQIKTVRALMNFEKVLNPF